MKFAIFWGIVAFLIMFGPQIYVAVRSAWFRRRARSTRDRFP
jgi:hypothetical protein